jgi:hypothetical protein
MSLSDIFTPSVVISLAISLLLIGLFGLYVSNKMNEQNHKLNSMFDLVSTLANELQMVRSQQPVGMGSVSMGGGGAGVRVYEKPEVANTNHLVNMIDVSDDSESSCDESDGETDEGAESGDDSDNDGSEGDGEGDGEEESGSDGEDEESDGDSDGEHDERSDKAIVVSESLDDTLFEELANLDDIVLEDTKVERVKTPETTPTQTNTNNVKNLNVVFDYKKASLGKLREIVEQKGLSSDTSKLKKQELLKMLEID